MKKRLVSVVTVTMMVFSLFGCGGNVNVSKDDVSGEIAQTESENDSLVIIEPVETTQGEEKETITETNKQEVETEIVTETVETTTQISNTEPIETTIKDEVSSQEESTEYVSDIDGNNQLTEIMNEEVEIFKCYTEIEQKLYTIETAVGGKASIRTAWSDYVLYSQDTGIANVEGKIIYGVSEGTTYVVIECGSLRQVYKIVVKGFENNENTESNEQLGNNQLTEKMREEVEVFKCYTEMEQKLYTIETTVGGKASIRTAWRDYKLYSEDTGIANIEGKIIYGVSKGTTYVVIECGSLRQVYKIIVE